MRHLIRGVGCVLFLIVFQAKAQYGNEWIDYNRSYYKIQIAQEGIYRLSYQTLVDAGIPVNGIDAKTFQLYHRGIEQAIFIENQGASQIEPGEYLEFYGQKNDGTLDAAMYLPASNQPHPYYNLYSDTTAYFLTWSSSNGKRMVFFNESNVGGLPAETSHNQEILNLYTTNYSLGHTINRYISQSHFDEGEGWTGDRIKEGNTMDFVISGVSLGLPSDGDPQLELLLVGRNELPDHDFKIYAGSSVGTLRELGSYTLQYFKPITISEPLFWTDIAGNGDLIVRIEVLVNGPTNELDNISMSYSKVWFPQLYDAQNLAESFFYTTENPGDKSYIEITNTPLNARVYDITDPHNVIRIGYEGGPNEVKAIIDQSSSTRSLLVTTELPLLAEPEIKLVSFQNYATTGDYVIITHPSLQKPFGSVQNAVKAYAEYRASVEGGAYDTLTVSIKDLINQYSYGEHSPLAIFNFMKRMVAEGNPEYLFLIGKGLRINHRYHRSDPALFSFHDLIPTGGAPASDVIFTAGLNGTTYEPAVATGRLTASTPEDVLNYLDKVKVKEALPFDELWQKELLHLSGGRSVFEKVKFKSYVDRYANVAKEVFLGGDVSTVTKNTTDNVEFINISEEINSGKLLVTFFGHSAPEITDIDIGFVTNPSLGYANAGKYPVFIVNGCNAGNFFENYINWGADWLLAKDLGATNFIAHTSYGFETSLNAFTTKMYETGFADSTFMQRPIGAIHKEASTRYLASASTHPVHRAQAQQMILNGDPAVRLFGTNIPDYEIRTDLISASSVDEVPISTSSPEFNIDIITENFGAAVSDSLAISIVRTLKNGEKIFYDTLLSPPVFYKDTLIFIVDNLIANNGGLNRFEITINSDRSINEHDYVNNTAFFDLIIPLNGTINLLPANYALVGNGDLNLLSQAADLTTDERTFLMEWDTTYLFNSPVKQQTMISAKEIALWNINIPEENASVYYWRSKYTEPIPGEEDEWEVSSLAFINGSTGGWGQLEFPQFLNSELNGIVADSLTRRWVYDENEVSLYVKTFGPNHPDLTFENVEVEIEGLSYIFAGRLCRDNTINAIAFNKSTALPYAVLFEEIFSPRTCGRQVQIINNYTEAEIVGTGNYLVNYIDALPSNDKVVLFTIGQVNYSTWTTEILDKLMEVGVDPADIQLLADGEPVIIFGQKGASPGEAQIITADYGSTTPPDEQEIQFNKNVSGKYSTGTIRSTKIGPALSWAELFTEVKSPDPPNEEQISFLLMGIEKSNDETVLFDGISSGSLDISSIDAVQFPNLRLEGTFTDTTNLTTPQLSQWMVTYETAPEGIIMYKGDGPITTAEGAPVSMNFAFNNLSNKDFSDSLLVIYSTFNLDSRSSDFDSLHIPPVKAGESKEFFIQLNTIGIVGINDINVVVNPGIITEQTYANNLINLQEHLIVEADETNPLVDVTFDGIHIFDGDIVAPSPLITVEIRDSNPYLAIEDTTAANIFLTYPCVDCSQARIQRISYNDPYLTWVPSDGDQPFTVEYFPQDLDNGMYQIEVQAMDASGNKAGIEPFRVNFEIINESTITNFYPYPNPFSTSTRFVFTLTGNDIPDEIIIQIMTISGKVVRVITQDELGPLRIGNNLSEYAWDGRDEFGDQLANGPYLYKVNIRINGESIDLRESAGDKGFKKGYGKLYLLR